MLNADRTRKMDKKILFVSNDLKLQGGPVSLFHLARAFTQKGYDVQVLAMAGGELYERYKAEKIKVTIWDQPPNIIPDTTNEKWFLMASGFFCENKFDLIFLNTMLTYYFLLIPGLDKRKCIWCIRESERDYFFDLLDTNGALNIGGMFGQVGKVLFVSKATRAVYEDLNTAENFEVIHNGINLKEIEEFRSSHSKEQIKKELNLAPDSKIFLNVGAVTERKGQKDIVEAAIRYIREKKDRDIYFFLVGGSNSDYEFEIRKAVSDYNLITQIYVIPEVRDVFKYFMIADCFLFTSTHESLPRAIMEAMAFELPIISTDVFGVAEEIENGKSGIFIRPGDPDALLEKVRYLDGNPAVARSLGQEAHKAVDARFSLERMIEDYERFFEAFLNDREALELTLPGELMRRIARATEDFSRKTKLEKTVSLLREYGVRETIKRARISLALRTLRKCGAYPVPAERPRWPSAPPGMDTDTDGGNNGKDLDGA